MDKALHTHQGIKIPYWASWRHWSSGKTDDVSKFKQWNICRVWQKYVLKLSFWNFSFYRYVLEPEISFTADNNFASGPIAKFLDMPQSPLFTLNLNTPESWMVESVRTPYDLDNIYLEEVCEISMLLLLHLNIVGFPGGIFVMGKVFKILKW